MLTRSEPPIARVKRFVNSNKLDHELVVVAVSYLFVFAGAWNDELIGLKASIWSALAESLMAIVLVAEVVTRLMYTHSRSRSFYWLIVFDAISILTVIPIFTGLSFARLGRLGYASLRTIRLIDDRARKTRQTMYLLITYPLIIPLAAAILFAVERQSAHPTIKTYLQALAMSVGFAVTLGSDRPQTYTGNLICGLLFVGGIICIGIIANSLSERYQVRDTEFDRKGS